MLCSVYLRSQLGICARFCSQINKYVQDSIKKVRKQTTANTSLNMLTRYIKKCQQIVYSSIKLYKML